MKTRAPYTVFHKVTTALSALVVAASIGYTLLVYPSLPDRIPVHFNFRGEPDGWGGKGSLWLLPIMSLAMFLLMAVVGHFPALWNFPLAITDQNRDFIWRQIRNMLCVMNLSMVALFGYMHYCSANSLPLNSWTLIVVLALYIIGPIVWMVILYKKGKRY